MKEQFCLVDHEGAFLWMDPVEGATQVSIPDSVERWEAIWKFRKETVVIAHSHPVGPSDFSHTDRTTMDALVLALAPEVLFFAVVSPIGTRFISHRALTRKFDPWSGSLLPLVEGSVMLPRGLEPGWAKWLRQASMQEEKEI